jgi:dTDP-4-amino-4,6-dideoxygalactose transaminase
LVIERPFLPYCAPSVGEEEIAEVVDSIRSGFLSAGPKAKRFEEDFAAYIGVEFAIAVNSCTSALEIALASLDIGPGDEVIVPTLTFCATANVVEHRGATPVLIDVDWDLQIDPNALGAAVSPKTRAIIPVHYGGQACNLDRILEIADARRIPVIQDAAHAAGAIIGGKKIGSEGLVTAFSFYPSKNMTTGEGGMLTTNDSSLANRCRQLRLHGISRVLPHINEVNGLWAYDVREPGYKATLTDIQAAIGIQQLRKLDKFIARRRQIATRYTDSFSDIAGIVLPGDLPRRPHTHHLYPLRIIRGEAAVNRDDLMNRLYELGIATSVHYIPLHRHPFYFNKYGHLHHDFPVADRVAQELVSLPLYPAMSDADIDRVIGALRDTLV